MRHSLAGADAIFPIDDKLLPLGGAGLVLKVVVATAPLGHDPILGAVVDAVHVHVEGEAQQALRLCLGRVTAGTASVADGRSRSRPCSYIVQGGLLTVRLRDSFEAKLYRHSDAWFPIHSRCFLINRVGW